LLQVVNFPVLRFCFISSCDPVDVSLLNPLHEFLSTDTSGRSGSSPRPTPTAFAMAGMEGGALCRGRTFTHEMKPEHETKFRKMIHGTKIIVSVDSTWSPLRVQVAEVLCSTVFEYTFGCIIITQFVFAVLETDELAKLDPHLPWWLPVVMYGFTVVYLIEISVRIFAYRRDFFNSRLNLMDFAVVTLDLFLQIFSSLIGELPSVSILRIFRLARLARALRVLTSFRELYIMLHSFIGAMKAILCSSVMIFVVLTIWAMVAVEILHPLNRELDHGDCDRCERAYSSVMQANLTLFQQILAGDSWGTVTVKMIEEWPLTAAVYIPAFVTVGMGLLNLTLTAIVDKAASARQANEQEALKLKLSVVQAIFKEMDDDDSGYVSFDEFLDGLNAFPEFATALSLLDIDLDDIRSVFTMMSKKENEGVSYMEFVHTLHRMKLDESHMVLLYLKHFTVSMETKITTDVQGIVGAMEVKLAAGFQASMEVICAKLDSKLSSNVQEPQVNLQEKSIELMQSVLDVGEAMHFRVSDSFDQDCKVFPDSIVKANGILQCSSEPRYRSSRSTTAEGVESSMQSQSCLENGIALEKECEFLLLSIGESLTSSLIGILSKIDATEDPELSCGAAGHYSPGEEGRASSGRQQIVAKLGTFFASRLRESRGCWRTGERTGGTPQYVDTQPSQQMQISMMQKKSSRMCGETCGPQACLSHPLSDTGGLTLLRTEAEPPFS